MERLKYILLKADISLTCLLVGISLLIWGPMAIQFDPPDFLTYISDGVIVSWYINYTVAGIGLVLLAFVPKNHSTLKLCIGVHSVIVWTWAAFTRDYSHVTSGIILNFMVILVGLLIVHRSSLENE